MDNLHKTANKFLARMPALSDTEFWSSIPVSGTPHSHQGTIQLVANLTKLIRFIARGTKSDISLDETWTELGSNEMSAHSVCCSEAIPSTFKHLVYLTQPSVTQNVLTTPLSSAALITCFMSQINSGSYIETKPSPWSSIPHLTTFYFFIQVKTLRPSLASPTCLGSAQRATISQSSPFSCVTESTEYFAPIEDNNSDTILAPRISMQNKKWRQLREDEALECLRLPGSQIVIGDGEDWAKLKGVEKLWCDKHGLFFEMRAWYRAS
ncbi:hypothetical protein BJ875DRAFT_94001 [Amylocarpus encephaloides]|uniref:Uncharacterized protein n=1 Tax=Amylocarpus encephaloides TaxID=45428 RepID=A0A9P8C337_9HELO|nr:hypothetical protein BJ875DRAFT_94001 [Amylocarpus encephaloides]